MGVRSATATATASPALAAMYEVTSTNKKVCMTLVGDAMRIAISVSACICMKAAHPLRREHLLRFLLACDLMLEEFSSHMRLESLSLQRA